MPGLRSSRCPSALTAIPDRSRVVDAYDATAVADRSDTARGAAREDLVGLDIEHHGAVATGGDGEDMNALDTEELIGPGAPRHAGTTHTVGHVRVFSCQLLGRC